ARPVPLPLVNSTEACRARPGSLRRPRRRSYTSPTVLVSDNPTRLEQRVVRAAEAALERNSFVSPIDVLIGMGWLPPSFVDQWRQGPLPDLEGGAAVDPHKLSSAMGLFRSWAVGRGLQPSEIDYVASTRDRRAL